MNKEEFEKVFAAAAEKSGMAELARKNQFVENLEAMMCELRNKLDSFPAEQANEELEKTATTLTNEIVGELNVGDYTDYSGHNTHWHSFKEGVVAGAQWQKEQMMKSAIDGCYIIRNRYNKENVLSGLDVTSDMFQKFNNGDKVKIIVIKDDE